MNFSRRNFIQKTALAAAGIPVAANLNLQAGNSVFYKDHENLITEPSGQDAFRFSIFSKTLQWLNYSEMAKVVADLGFDGIDLTVRADGHVLPERVEEDLPKAMEAAKKSGINIYSIVTSISNVEDSVTEKILKTASSLGIGHYRMNWLNYNEAKTIEENLTSIQSVMGKLTVLNEKYKIRGEYQNHSGRFKPEPYFGSSIWDLHSVLKNSNSPWLGSQYDIMHAMVEGAYSWDMNFKLLNPFVYSLAIKDFIWKKNHDKWAPEVVPLGEGMVNFSRYFDLLKHYQIKCPISIHYEYSLGGAEQGKREISMSKNDLISAIDKDLATVKRMFKEANLI